MFGDRNVMSFRFGGMAIGAVAALLIVLPFVGATYLDRSYGNTVTISVLTAVAALAVIGAVVVFVKRFLIMGLLLVNLAFWCGVAVYITTRIEW